MIVVDSGAYFEALLDSRGGAIVSQLLILEDSFAPELLDVEVLHRIVRSAQHGLIDSGTAEAFVTDLELAPMERIRHRELTRRALRFTASLSAYDAFYVALAELLACPLVTVDARLAATAGAQFGVTTTVVPSSGRDPAPGG